MKTSHLEDSSHKKKLPVRLEVLIKMGKFTAQDSTSIFKQNIKNFKKVLANDTIFLLISKDIITIDEALKIDIPVTDFNEQEKNTLNNTKIQNYLANNLINFNDAIISAKNNPYITFTSPALTYIQKFINEKRNQENNHNQISIQTALQLGPNERDILSNPIIKKSIEEEEITIAEAISITQDQQLCLNNYLVKDLINNNQISIQEIMQHSTFINNNTYFLDLLKLNLLTKEEAKLILNFTNEQKQNLNMAFQKLFNQHLGFTIEQIFEYMLEGVLPYELMHAFSLNPNYLEDLQRDNQIRQPGRNEPNRTQSIEQHGLALRNILSDPQSTHQATIHQTVANSIKKLYERYLKNKEKIERQQEFIKLQQYIANLPDDDNCKSIQILDKEPANKDKSVFYLIKNTPNNTFIAMYYNVNTKEWVNLRSIKQDKLTSLMQKFQPRFAFNSNTINDRIAIKNIRSIYGCPAKNSIAKKCIKRFIDRPKKIWIPDPNHARRGLWYQEEIGSPKILDSIEKQSNISLKSTLTATFLAANDTKKLLGYKSELTAIAASNEKLKLQALDNFIKGLYNMQRGYNIDADGIDDNKPNLPICISGCFNGVRLKVSLL